ncbi:MAG: hypothetical protein FJZ86_02770 [Chloroflexi bacterium]|nr:hypothetical protein [Chloroflexota bacterium]
MEKTSNRPTVFVLIVAAIAVSLAAAFLTLHVLTPSDGARLQPGDPVWRADGVIVTPLVEQPDGLQSGDRVIAVAGRSMEDWAQALFQMGVSRPNWQFGQTIIYTVLRDGQPQDIQVALGRYPFGAILRKDYGTILFALLSELICAFVFLRRPKDQAARVLFLWASAILSATTWSFGLQVNDLVNGIGFWLYKFTTFGAYLLFYITGAHFALIFPKPLPFIEKRRWIVPVMYLLPYGLYIVYLWVIRPGSLSTLDWLGRWIPGETFLSSGGLLMMICFVIWNYRANTDAIARQKIRWVVLAVMISGVGGLLFWLMPALFLGRPIISANALGLLVLPFPISIAIAILRYQLFDINIVINRALVYGTLTTIIAALYVLIVGVLGNYLHRLHLGSHESIDLLVSLMATALVAVSFQPLREWLQRWVNHWMYGERDDPYSVLARLGQKLEAAGSVETILPSIVEMIAQALKLPYVAIEFKDEDGSRVVAAYGTPQPYPAIKIPLIHQNASFADLVLAPRSQTESFTPAEERLLTDLAREVEVAAHNVRLTADLQRSRQELVTSREEERRRIRRDLHDEIGPLLASQSLTLDAIEKLIAQDPAAATSLVRDLKGQTQGAVQEIRRIIYDLRPPALDDLGLVEALKERFVQLGQSRPALSKVEGLKVELEAQENIPSLSAAVETAVYRIAVEAVTNVVRHANANDCHVCLRVDGNLQLEISDDGAGLPPKYRAGVGLRAMQERAEELGGTFRIERASKGTRLVVTLPISAEDE